jgi:hypothetical protein
LGQGHPTPAWLSSPKRPGARRDPHASCEPEPLIRTADTGRPSAAGFDMEYLPDTPQTAMTGSAQGEVGSAETDQGRAFWPLRRVPPIGPYLKGTPNNVDGSTPTNSESDIHALPCQVHDCIMWTSGPDGLRSAHGCEGTACRTHFNFIARPNQEGTASRTPTARQRPVAIVKNWMLQLEYCWGAQTTKQKRDRPR